MEKKQYVSPDIKMAFMEDLMDPGIHNSVSDGEQLGNEGSFDEEEPLTIKSPNVWE